MYDIQKNFERIRSINDEDITNKFISPMETIKAWTPNACTNCHKDQTPEWAQKTLREWLLK